MKLIILLFLFFPLALHAQTWQKVFTSARRAAVMRPQLSSAASRKALRRAYKEMEALAPNMQKWLSVRLGPVKPALSARLNGWAAQSNRLMLKENALLRAQITFFAQHLPAESQAWPNAAFRPEKLADCIKESTDYVIVGGKQEEPQAFTVFQKLVQDYRTRHPQREIIVFLENLPDKGVRFVSPLYAPQRVQPAVEMFSQFRVRVAGVGDASVRPSGYLKQEKSHLILPAVAAPASVAAQSAHMRRCLANWRKEYPQAVFFVYASPQAAAYDTRHSLVNRLPEEQALSISVASLRETRTFLFHRWTQFKYARSGMFAWNEQEWARMSGFDAQVILP